MLTACDVHEWPETPESTQFHLRLNYKTEMTEWHHQYNKEEVVEQGYGEIYDNHLEYGKIRYIVRAYPILEKNQSPRTYSHEFLYTKNISDGYNHEVTLDLPEGDYQIMVWSDMIESSDHSYFYDATNFAEIVLQGLHQANTDHRDAFYGIGNITLVSDIMEYVPDTLDITMQRPMAKYEFITTDLEAFVKKELEYLSKEAESRGEEAPSRVIFEDYRAVFYYSGFMPNTYNMYLNKPVDSAQNIMYESKLELLGNGQASLGFDYVYTNGVQSAVTIQVGFYDKEERQVALSAPINVPLCRDHHTIMKGAFLISETSGGIIIHPEFDGNHNIIIK